jgi:hypothetical protein
MPRVGCFDGRCVNGPVCLVSLSGDIKRSSSSRCGSQIKIKTGITGKAPWTHCGGNYSCYKGKIRLCIPKIPARPKPPQFPEPTEGGQWTQAIGTGGERHADSVGIPRTSPMGQPHLLHGILLLAETVGLLLSARCIDQSAAEPQKQRAGVVGVGCQEGARVGVRCGIEVGEGVDTDERCRATNTPRHPHRVIDLATGGVHGSTRWRIRRARKIHYG